MSKWFYKNKKIDRELSNKLGIHPAIIKILADRGVETEEDIREFLAADLSKVSDGSWKYAPSFIVLPQHRHV